MESLLSRHSFLAQVFLEIPALHRGGERWELRGMVSAHCLRCDIAYLQVVTAGVLLFSFKPWSLANKWQMCFLIQWSFWSFSRQLGLLSVNPCHYESLSNKHLEAYWGYLQCDNIVTEPWNTSLSFHQSGVGLRPQRHPEGCLEKLVGHFLQLTRPVLQSHICYFAWTTHTYHNLLDMLGNGCTKFIVDQMKKKKTYQ